MTKITNNTIHLAIGFMLMFTSTTSASTIISVLLRQLGYHNLGLYTIFINSFFFVIGGLIAPYCGNRYNSKWLMIVSLSCYAFKLSTYIIVNFVHVAWFVYSLIILGASVSGFFACFLWMAQGSYMHIMCEREEKQKQKGYYFGLFYRIYSISNILAGVATTFLLGYFTPIVYFCVLAASGIGSVLYILFFVQKLENVTITQQQQNQIKSSLITTVSIQKEQKTLLISNQKHKFNPLDLLKFYPKMLVMLTFIGVIGFIMGFYNSSLGDLISLTLPEDSTNQYINMRIGIGIILLGFGEIIGGYVSGHNADRWKIQTIGSIGLCMYLFVCQLSILNISIKSSVFVYLISFLWGLMHSYLQNWVIICCSRNYDGRLESFTINKQFHSITLCIYQLIVIFGTQNLTLILTMMTFLTIICIPSLTLLKAEGNALKKETVIGLETENQSLKKNQQEEIEAITQ